jgi:hypothetical protein
MILISLFFCFFFILFDNYLAQSPTFPRLTRLKFSLTQDIYAVHDCFKQAGGHDIFLLDWRQVLSYDVSLLNIRLVVNSLIDSM